MKKSIVLIPLPSLIKNSFGRSFSLSTNEFEIRESHFTAKSLRMLFKDISPENILNFLKETNIFGKI